MNRLAEIRKRIADRQKELGDWFSSHECTSQDERDLAFVLEELRKLRELALSILEKYREAEHSNIGELEDEVKEFKARIG